MTVGPSDNIFRKLHELAAQIEQQCLSFAPGWTHQLQVHCPCNENGLQLGSGLTADNISKAFAILRFKTGSILISGCGAAAIYRMGNNGLLMCKRLAASAYSNVTASGGFTLHQLTATWNALGKLTALQEHDVNGALVNGIPHPGHTSIEYFKHTCHQKASQPGTPVRFSFSTIMAQVKVYALQVWQLSLRCALVKA